MALSKERRDSAKPALARRRSSGMRVDVLTLLGISLAIGAVLAGNWLEGGELSSLLQLTAFVIVIGGTLGAVMIQTPPQDLRLALRRAPWVFLPPRFPRDTLLEKAVRWSRRARKEGLLSLEGEVLKEPDALTKKGLRLLVDGLEPEDIRAAMEVEIDNAIALDIRAARVFDALGGYSPTIGIIGAVLGLIHVMNNLSDPAELGHGIAVAFVATIYGVGFANLFFLPVANKLKAISGDQTGYHEMVVDGIALIADGDNPSVIQSKLEGYLD